jgi:hypothetical protein
MSSINKDQLINLNSLKIIFFVSVKLKVFKDVCILGLHAILLEELSKAWQGQFYDRNNHNSIILEIMVNQSFWIRHSHFGLPSGNNEMNLLDKSSLVFNLLCGLGADLKFNVNVNLCSRYYLLVDGMHLKLACFVQTIHEPLQGKQWKHFSQT